MCFQRPKATHGSTVLRAAGFVLDQSPQLTDLDLDAVRARALIARTPPPLGPYRSFQVSIVDIAALTGLDLAATAKADVLAPLPSVRDSSDPRALWVELIENSVVHL